MTSINFPIDIVVNTESARKVVEDLIKKNKEDVEFWKDQAEQNKKAIKQYRRTIDYLKDLEPHDVKKAELDAKHWKSMYEAADKKANKLKIENEGLKRFKKQVEHLRELLKEQRETLETERKTSDKYRKALNEQLYGDYKHDPVIV